jgi:Natural resistance-associated macrophage protein-like
MTDSLAQATLTDRAILAAGEALAGQRRGLGSLLPFAGPAVMASVAYMDPGNFATNIQAGAKFNYNLLWVVVVANVIAMLFQALSAKLGIITGRNLAELCRERFPQPLVWAMWVVSEIGAMATDLAEFLGGAIGLSLLFGMPLLAGMVITGIATYAILTLQRGGFRPIELLIGGLVGVIGASYLVELLIAPPDWSGSCSIRSCRTSATARRSCSPSASSAPRSCRTRFICTRASLRIVSSREPIESESGCSSSRTARSCWRSVLPVSSTWRWSQWPLPSSTTASTMM